MIPAISQVSSLPSSFADDMDQFAAAGCRAVDLWLTKLEDYLKTHSIEQAVELMQKRDLRPVAASFQGGLLASQGPARAEAWKLFEARLQLCSRMGVDVLVTACDVAGPLDEAVLERVRISLIQAAQQAEAVGVRIALEFQCRSALGNNLQSAALLVQEAARPNLGLCLDAFHFFCGPSKFPDLGYLSQDNLFHVQVCDLLATPRELAADSHRIVPGDGDLPLEPLFERLRDIDYQGPVAVELMNPLIWQSPARQIAEIAMAGLQRLL